MSEQVTPPNDVGPKVDVEFRYLETRSLLRNIQRRIHREYHEGYGPNCPMSLCADILSFLALSSSGTSADPTNGVCLDCGDQYSDLAGHRSYGHAPSPQTTGETTERDWRTRQPYIDGGNGNA